MWVRRQQVLMSQYQELNQLTTHLSIVFVVSDVRATSAPRPNMAVYKRMIVIEAGQQVIAGGCPRSVSANLSRKASGSFAHRNASAPAANGAIR